MEITYNVRIYELEVRNRSKSTSYRVRWTVESEVFRRTFKHSGLAKTFRGSLLTSTSTGEAFSVADGLPVSMARDDPAKKVTCLTVAVKYVDHCWPDSSPGHRRNMVEALISVLTAAVTNDAGMPALSLLRTYLRTQLNPRTRTPEADNSTAGKWIIQHSAPVARLANVEMIDAVIRAIGTQLNGSPTADSTRRRKRATLTHFLDYAVLRGPLERNPLPDMKHKTGKAKPMRQVEGRSVANPMQARTLLNAVKEVGEHGRRLYAFFACIYYAGLRPEEVAGLTRADLSISDSGWGDIHLCGAIPEIGAEWTDSGVRGEVQPLKHRARGEGRTVPCCPELTAILRWHLATYGTGNNGRLFRGHRDGGRIGSSVYGRVWAQARQLALTPQVYASPLATTPYDLRHACLSTWLAAGVAPKLVADWAGHSLAVLLHVYAKCLDGGAQAARNLVEAFMGAAAPGAHRGQD